MVMIVLQQIAHPNVINMANVKFHLSIPVVYVIVMLDGEAQTVVKRHVKGIVAPRLVVEHVIYQLLNVDAIEDIWGIIANLNHV